jgi:endonuclease YncB( thermonuclease family)
MRVFKFLLCGTLWFLTPNWCEAKELFPGPYAARAVRVVDGDTLIAEVQVYPQVIIRTSVRLRGIDTPESRRPKCEAERRLGLKAKRFVKKVVPISDSFLKMRLKRLKLGKYAGRVLADVEIKRGKEWIDLARLLQYNRLGRKYFGGKKGNWCNDTRSETTSSGR